MTGGRRLVLAILALQLAGEAESGSECGILVELEDDGLVVVTAMDGLEPGRYSFGFDPSCESMELISATFERNGETAADLPSWAVDTLTGTDGYPLALFVAFPPGGRGSLTIRETYFDRLSRERPSLVLSVPAADAAISVRVRDAPDSLLWEGHGFAATRDGDDLLVTAAGPAGPLALSWLGGWGEMYRRITSGSDSTLSGDAPLASREAAIEAGAAGAAPAAQIARLRTLMCNSLRIERPKAPGAMLDVGTLDEIFRTRIATPLEACTAFISVCRRLGMDCELVLAGGGDWSIPVASSWDRALVRITTSSRTFMVEPSAMLVPAFYIPDSDGLWTLARDDDEPRHLPADSGSPGTCRESWTLHPSGAFVLDAQASGPFDVEIRRRLAGLGEAAMATVVSTWLWRGGFTLEVDSVWTSDLYDLGEAAAFGAAGRLPPLSGGYLLLPALSWGAPPSGRPDRRWRIMSGDVLGPSDLAFEREAGSVTLFDTSSSPPPRMARIGEYR